MHFLPRELVVERRTTYGSKLFEEMFNGLRYGDLVVRLWGNGGQKLGNRISKKEAKTALENFSIIFFGSKSKRRS